MSSENVVEYKLFFDKQKKFSFWERVKFLFFGEIRLRLWAYSPCDGLMVNLQTKRFNGEWDEKEK